MYGYQQSYFTDAWSLGCVFRDAAPAPYTNIKIEERVIQINTNLTWGIPPHAGKHIDYLIIR